MTDDRGDGQGRNVADKEGKEKRGREAGRTRMEGEKGRSVIGQAGKGGRKERKDDGKEIRRKK